MCGVNGGRPGLLSAFSGTSPLRGNICLHVPLQLTHKFELSINNLLSRVGSFRFHFDYTLYLVFALLLAFFYSPPSAGYAGWAASMGNNRRRRTIGFN